MLIFTVSVSATGFSQNRVNFRAEKTEISKAIAAIENQTSFRFLYNESLKEIRKKISVNLEDATIEEALKALLQNTALSYQVLENQLIVIKNGVSENADPVVSGKVTDDQGEALIGVSVKVKGSNKGVSTNVNGLYSLEVPANATLVFTYIGFDAKEVKVGNQKTINVTLSPASNQLNEVVVVGYGTVKKASLTTAVASVGGGDIAERGTVSPIQAVQGQVAGVDIRTTSGRAGAGYNVQIRGQNSLSAAPPLFVVDGVIVDNIDFLNPQDIEKMDVLKDAASTAVYGSRGSNGVIQVTTKGKNSVKAGASISYDGYVGIRKNARMPEFMNGDQWWEYRQNAFITPELLKNPVGAYNQNIGGIGQHPTFDKIMANKQYTDWTGLVMQDGLQENHWLTVSGRSNNNMNYLIGAGVQNEKGNLVNEFFKRYNFKASVDHKLNERWSAGASVNFSLSEIERGSDLAVTNAFRMAPVVPAYDESGALKFRPGQFVTGSTTNLSMTSSVNPLLDNENSENNTRRTYGLGNLYLQFAPAKWMDIRSTFSPSLTYSRNGRYQGSQTEARGGLLPAAQLDNLNNFSYILDNVLNIRKSIKEDHSFDITGLFSIQKNRDETSFLSVRDLPFNSSFYNLGTAGTRVESLSGYSLSSIVSFMTRLNYSYKNKYLATVVNRWDGSSRLAEGHKWSSFPSLAIAWRIKEEAFLKDLNVLSDLKIRTSVGLSGNNNNVSAYETQATLSSPILYDFGGVLASGYRPGRLSNPSLTWEKSREYNLGIDYGFIRGRISGSVDFYDKLSDGLILTRDLPFETGYTGVKDNIASVSNKGIEVSLRTINISKKDFTWSTSFNFARNRNRIQDLSGGKDLPANAWFINQPINVNYNYIFDGIWQEDEKAAAAVYGQLPGQAKARDVDNDKRIGPSDLQVVGARDPKWTGGFSTSLTFKNFDFSASLFARQGMQVLSTFHQEFTNLADRGRQKLNVDYYMPANNVTPARSSNKYPQPFNTGAYWGSGMGYYRDNSFVKVQNISIAYMVPAAVSKRIKLSNLKVYANVLNPFVWSDYDGFDPEYASESLVSTGVSTVTYQFGVNARF